MPKADKKTQRIVALDLIRGYFLLVILINHLNRFPGFFDVFTGRGQLWTSAAEGFFLISGLLVGMIRGREAKSGRLGTAALKSLKRGLVLYVWTVILTVFFTIIGSHYLGNIGLKAGIEPFNSGNLWPVFGRALDLHYVYGWADFLQFYAVYMLIAPVFLFLLYKRLWPLALIIIVGLFGLKDHSQYFIWQLYFFGGALVGYYWPELTARLNHQSKNQQTSFRRGVYSAALVILAADLLGTFLFRILDRHNLLGAANTNISYRLLSNLHSLNGSWFNRFNPDTPYGIGRVAVSLVWFSALYLFVRQHEELIKKYLGKLLLPVGCNPLLVYGLGAVIIFSVELIFPHNTKFIPNTLINLAAIVLSWAVANFKIQAKKKQNLLKV